MNALYGIQTILHDSQLHIVYYKYLHTTDRKELMVGSAISFLFLPAKEVMRLSGHEQSELNRHAFEFWLWNLGQSLNAGDSRHGLYPWVGNIPFRRKWQSTPVLFLTGKSHGQRSLAGYSMAGRHKELDTA